MNVVIDYGDYVEEFEKSFWDDQMALDLNQADGLIKFLEEEIKSKEIAKTVPDFEDQWRADMQDALELDEKEKILKKSKTNKAFEKYEDEQKRSEAINSFSIDKDDKTSSSDIWDIDKIVTLEERISNSLMGVIGTHFPPMRNNLNIFMGKTGAGKSTFASELALAFCEAQIQVIYLANEEDCKNIYIRTAAMSLGYKLQSPEQYTLIELKKIKEKASDLCRYLKIYDDFSIKNVNGILSTPEGVKEFLKRIEIHNIKNNSIKAIIFDYYQGVNSSIGTSKEYEAQEKVVQVFEDFRNRVGIPLYVMGQLKDNDGSFQERIKGSKSISYRATGAIELISNKSTFLTRAIIHKARFSGSSVGKELYLKMIDSRLRFEREVSVD